MYISENCYCKSFKVSGLHQTDCNNQILSVPKGLRREYTMNKRVVSSKKKSSQIPTELPPSKKEINSTRSNDRVYPVFSSDCCRISFNTQLHMWTIQGK